MTKEDLHSFLTTFGEQKPSKNSKEQVTLAYTLYAASNYTDSETLFKSLTQELPLSRRNWFGLASSLMMQKKYEDALMPWAMTALLSDEDPMPHFHAAECLFSLGQKEEAQKALLLAKERAPYDESLLKNIHHLMERCSA
ncbi:MAG: hypothetical protein KBC64_00020 [Simkaniaceae bacterium]|nr:hypothetical protein [Simkaniaceae bacterium]